MTTPPTQIREYQARAETTRTFGRVLAGARDHHLVVDGPVQNGCPGEAVTPAELFLAAVASCGAELTQVIAREQNVPLDAVAVTITGSVDRSRQARADVTTFTRVHLDLVLTGADDAQAAALVEAFKRR
ncbi:MAG TPA: OsmC family protein [Gemmatimonadaceae bacterium]|nr:OsmC family protein [Gemmatimonadaceae bacterium]